MSTTQKPADTAKEQDKPVVVPTGIQTTKDEGAKDAKAEEKEVQSTESKDKPEVSTDNADSTQSDSESTEDTSTKGAAPLESNSFTK